VGGFRAGYLQKPSKFTGNRLCTDYAYSSLIAKEVKVFVAVGDFGGGYPQSGEALPLVSRKAAGMIENHR
jgi:hypothetical protein